MTKYHSMLYSHMWVYSCSFCVSIFYNFFSPLLLFWTVDLKQCNAEQIIYGMNPDLGKKIHEPGELFAFNSLTDRQDHFLPPSFHFLPSEPG